MAQFGGTVAPQIDNNSIPRLLPVLNFLVGGIKDVTESISFSSYAYNFLISEGCNPIHLSLLLLRNTLVGIFSLFRKSVNKVIFFITPELPCCHDLKPDIIMRDY